MASVYTHRNFYTETLLQRSFYTQQAFTEKVLHREAFLYIITTGIAAPKPDLDAKATKRRF